MNIKKLLDEAFDAGYKCGRADGKMEGCLEAFQKMRDGRSAYERGFSEGKLAGTLETLKGIRK